MTITNETKIGALASVSIVLLILGFNFLKGKNLLEREKDIFAVFPKVDGLSTSDAVRINGYQVGKITSIRETDPEMAGVVVSIQITKDIRIPDDSYAVINSNPLGATVVNIIKGKSTQFINEGDTLNTSNPVGLLDEISPTLDKVSGTLTSLDSLIEVMGSTFDPSTKGNLKQMIANLEQGTANLNNMLAAKGSLGQTMSNLQDITQNLRGEKDTINRILSNTNQLTGNLAKLDLNTTVNKLQQTADELNLILASINSGKGSAGLLLNDKRLYDNLNASAKSLNILLQDLRVHPKRYVNISVFGKKDKSGPLMEPLTDSSQKQ